MRKPIISVVVLMALFALMGCQGPFELRAALGLDLDIFTVSPDGIVVDKDIASLAFTASPAGSYTWSVLSGSGSIDPVTGVYTPSGAVEYVTVQAEDAQGYYGRARVRMEAGLSLQILAQTRNLFPGESAALYAYGGNGGPYAFSVSVNNSGADPIVGSTYVAGPTPGTDTVQVTDGTSIDTLTIEVIDPATNTPDIDYRVSSVTFTAPTRLAEVLSANFVYENTGTAGDTGTIDYSAYISTSNNLTGIVSHLQSGTVSALGAGATSTPVGVSGTWPDDGGSYYIVVHLTPAVDANPGDNAGSSSATTMSVDYTATATPPAAVIPPAVGTIHNFTVTNGGTVTGAAPLAWTAYYSADAFFGTEDSIFDSGTAAASLFDPDETITVNWPATAPTGYQILRFESPDDPGTPATAVSGLITRGVVDVDYGPLTAPAGGTVTVGTALSGVNFAVENTGSDPGSVPIEWTAWISSDATPGNSGDVQVDSGSIGALGAAPDNSGSVSVTGNWSVPVGDYWLIVTWNAADDGNSGNDSVTSALQYQVQTTDVDYEADTPPDGGNALLAGSATAISETFTLQNSGSAAGSQTLSWIAWMSEGDAVLNAGDYQIDSGTVVPLPGPLASTAPISIGGFWPDDPGSYDIILTWNALDDNDTSNDSMTTAASTTVSLPSTDYTVSVPAPGGTVQAGGAVSGSITVQNTGPDDDPAGGFNWAVYASTDTAYNSGDALIDSGIGAPMDVLDPPAGIPYAGTWPDIGGDYHIVAVIDAMYDANTANDEAYDVSGPTAVINATDYTIENVQYHPLGVPGDVVANRPTPPAHPAALDFRFNIRETNGIEGSRKVDYVVHASTDTILDGGDIDLKADFVKANDVGAGGTFTVDFTDAGAWPAFPQPYYLIITINAADDVDPANDIFVAGPVQVAVYGSDTEPNDDSGPFTTTPSSFTDLSGDLPTGELRPDELVRIDGITDGPGGYDTYGFIAGTGMTSVDLKLTWNTGSNTADMFLWNELNGEAESIEVTADLEEMTVISLTPGDWYYIGVQQLAGPAADYALTITGRP